MACLLHVHEAGIAGDSKLKFWSQNLELTVFGCL